MRSVHPQTHQRNIQRFGYHHTENKLLLLYRNQSVNAAGSSNRCLFLKSYKTHKHTVWRKYSVLDSSGMWVPLNLEGLVFYSFKIFQKEEGSVGES